MTVDQMIDEAGGDRAHLSTEVITEIMQQDALTAYQRREEELTPEMMRELERRVVLSVLDRKWREHLYEMDYLREGITLRGYGQRDPLIEYQREGYDMFSAMMEGIKEESVASLFNLQVQWQENPIVEDATPGGAPNGASQGGFVIAPAPGAGGALPGVAAQGPAAAGVAEPGPPARPGRHSRTGAHARPAGQPGAGEPEAPSGPAIPAALAGRGLDRPQRRGGLQYSAPSEDASGKSEKRAPASSSASSSSGGADYSKVGRNAPCPCGSGRKFKQCHGDPRNR
jgi:preprotein translocase subunit SecA